MNGFGIFYKKMKYFQKNIFQKFLENNFSKISFPFLVEDAKPLYLICELLFYC